MGSADRPRRQNMAILEPERWQAEFLAMVSHELRAPLSSIIGSTTTLLTASPGLAAAETREFLRIIDEQARQMRGLIGDLLDAGRIETGTLSLTPEPVDVAGLVDQARRTFLRSSVGESRIRIDLPPDLPRVMADRQRILQVLNDLLANAARNSPPSAPIRVAAAQDGRRVAVSVSDEGRGVPPERLPHLFRRHAGAAGIRGEGGRGGHGLALAICKGLVEAHGGRLRAESAGDGTRVTFTIPATEETESATPSRPAANGSPAPRDGKDTRVLVVDDDPQTLRYLRDTLTAAGYVPFVAADPRELPELLRTHDPQLVMLDLLPPGSDGIELLASVPELADVPVIFLSAYGRDEAIARALRAGAADYIVKPFSPTELTARIQAALRRTTAPEEFVLGDLAIDYRSRRVTVADRVVHLTPGEYELLRVLSVRAGRVTTYGYLLHRRWNRATPDTRLVRAVVKRLRRKLGDDAARPKYVFTERGVGYRMPEPE